MNNVVAAKELFHAARSRSQGRKGWCIMFRHPLVRDARQRPVRVRRGLSTRDDQEAETLVQQMNRLLGDETYWSPAARARAAREFDPRIVAIFYDYRGTIDRQTLDEGHGQVIPLRF